MNYTIHWDLSTIPTDLWNQENGRRQRAKAPAATNEKLLPCAGKGCGWPLNATQRRKPCPNCGYKHPRGPIK